MDDIKKNLIRDHIGLAAIVIGGINSFDKEVNPVSKFKTCIAVRKTGFGSTFDDGYFISTADMLDRTFESKSDLRKFNAAIEEIYKNDFVDFSSADKGDIEGLVKLVEEFLIEQDKDDYVSPEVVAEVEQMVKDIEDGNDIDDDESIFDIEFESDQDIGYGIDDDFDDEYGADEI